MQIEIDTLKRGGCANTIVKGMGEIDGVSSGVVETTLQLVRLQANEGAKPAVLARLHRMGYPEKGSVNGLDAAVAGAKSPVSRAIGRLG